MGAGRSQRSWTLAQAEQHLLARELFGMRFGLDRMRRLLTVLGHPERRFASIHVVGSNGKSSTARMIAAILERHGLCAGAYLSPHLRSFTERVRVGEADLDDLSFAAAVARAASAAERVDRTLRAPDRVTQFELLTAAAYSELARREVDVAVVEAGLGGRYDATNVIPSRVQVLTGVGLEHQRWLGPSVRDIAREKLAVVRDEATLVIGALSPDADEEACAAAAAHGAALIRAPLDPGVPLAALGAFQRRNFALACTAAQSFLGELDPPAVRAAAASVVIPGRLELIDDDPSTLRDGAHNPAGIGALVESLPPVLAGRALVAAVSILDDKDAAAMLAGLLPHCRRAVFCACSHPRALSPATLASLAGQLAGPPSEIEADPARALARARELAQGLGGVALATGSLYLLADLEHAAEPAARRSTL